MEYWNVGILGMAELDLILYGWHGPENKIRPSSAFDPLYSIFHFSTIPLFHEFFDGKHHPSGVKSKPGPLDQDSLIVIWCLGFGYYPVHPFNFSTCHLLTFTTSSPSQAYPSGSGFFTKNYILA
jgi:hypothetical protein